MNGDIINAAPVAGARLRFGSTGTYTPTRADSKRVSALVPKPTMFSGVVGSFFISVDDISLTRKSHEVPHLVKSYLQPAEKMIEFALVFGVRMS